MPRLIARPIDRASPPRKPRRAAKPTPPARRPAPRRRLPRLRRNLAMVAMAALVVTGSTAAAGWLWRSGHIGAQVDAVRTIIVAASVEAGFAIAEIEVEGRRNTPAAAILEALDLRRGQPLATVDLDAARLRIEELGWVRSATVERRWPDTIRVRLIERRPMALWQQDGRLAVVDGFGVVASYDDVRDFAHLPLIVGEDAPAHAAPLLQALDSDPDLRARIAAMVRVGNRRWNLRLTDGTDIRLPEDGLDEAWRRLGLLQREQGLLDRVELVDMRLPDRLIVREADDARIVPIDGKDT